MNVSQDLGIDKVDLLVVISDSGIGRRLTVLTLLLYRRRHHLSQPLDIVLLNCTSMIFLFTGTFTCNMDYKVQICQISLFFSPAAKFHDNQ